MTFDDWYETYEPNGAELLIFNTTDLAAAYAAGQKETATRCRDIAMQMFSKPVAAHIQKEFGI